MPELPEVETVCSGLVPVMKNKVITTVKLNRPNLRFPFPEQFAKRLEGKRVLDIHRRAKYILVNLSDNLTLLWHLGMSGHVILNNQEPTNKHDHVIFTLESGQQIRYRDPRRFGLMDLSDTDTVHQHRLINSMGIEPLSVEFTPSLLKQILQKKSAPIKNVLLDGRCVAGIGNIYACEALYAARINPLTPANKVKNADKLTQFIKEILNNAILAGGSTLKDHAQPNGELGYFQQMLQVYGRDGMPCYTCGALIIKITQAGRSTFLCPTCQKADSNIKCYSH